MSTKRSQYAKTVIDKLSVRVAQYKMSLRLGSLVRWRIASEGEIDNRAVIVQRMIAAEELAEVAEHNRALEEAGLISGCVPAYSLFVQPDSSCKRNYEIRCASVFGPPRH
jgi:hypothetical protein